MPVMFSCRNALIRAISVRTVRYDSRTCTRNHCVTSTISGSTENAISDSRQSIVNSTIMMPVEHEHVAEGGDDAGGEEIVEDVDVAGDARHQAADRIAIVVAQIEPLQVPVDLHAHVEHDALADHLHQPGLHVFEHEAAGEHQEEPHRDPADAAEIARRRCSCRSRP